MLKKIILAIVIVIAVFTGLFIYSAIKLNSKPDISESVIIHIPAGTSKAQAIDLLNAKGILKPGWLFEPFVNLYALASDSHIHEGYYRFHHQLKNMEIIYSIFNGKNLYTVKVTFPEGINLKQFASIIKRKTESDSAEFIELCHSREFIKKLGLETNSLEGWLMPDTYMLYWKHPVDDIIRRLADAQSELWKDNFESRAEELNMTRIKALTLASIIEAETKYEPEKKRISGVYHNRLKRGMLLQADPTVQYALGVRRRLLYRDLSVASPYNTYLYPGLPPGPINSPGESSIDAALNPEKHDFLYFVAVGDGSGSHNFSSGFVGHQTNISEYKKNLRKNNNK